MKVKCEEGDDPAGPCVRCQDKLLDCICESPRVENIWAKKQLPARAAKSTKAVPPTSGKAQTKPAKAGPSQPVPAKAGPSQPVPDSPKQFEWDRHPVFDAPGPAWNLLMGGSDSASDADVAAACLYWHGEVARAGAAEEVAQRLHKFALRMCTAAFTHALARRPDDSRPAKRARSAKGKEKAPDKAQADAMEEDEEVIVVDPEQWVYPKLD